MDGDLYRKAWSFENLYAAYCKARRGKRGRPPAASSEFDLEGKIQSDALSTFYRRRPIR